METSTIVGIMVAVAIILLGLRMVFKKPKTTEPSLQNSLHINPESNTPVIPRHVRDQLQTAQTEEAERIEPTFNDKSIAIEADAEHEPKIQLNANITEVIATEAEAEKTAQPVEVPAQIVAEVVQSAQAEVTGQETAEKKNVTEPTLSLNPEIETAAISEFDGESSILDVHLHEQQRVDDESALSTAEMIIALNVYPNPHRALSGDKVLKILLKYGLRYGEMSCFHRHEKTDEPSPLMFSVLRMTDQGPAGFDLETLSGEQVNGLAFFLALPTPHAVTGFDMMASIAGLIAREIDGKVFDEQGLELTPQLKEHWRHQVIDYRTGQVA